MRPLSGTRVSIEDLVVQKAIVHSLAHSSVERDNAAALSSDYAWARPAVHGDLATAIDSRATLRTGKTHVKEYIKVDERPIHLIVDCSPAMHCGFGSATKAVRAAQLSAQILWQAKHRQITTALTLVDGLTKHSLHLVIGTSEQQLKMGLTAISKQVANLNEAKIDIDDFDFAMQAQQNTLEALNRYPQNNLCYISSFDWWPDTGTNLTTVTSQFQRLALIHLQSVIELTVDAQIEVATADDRVLALNQSTTAPWQSQQQRLAAAVSNAPYYQQLIVDSHDTDLSWNSWPWQTE